MFDEYLDGPLKKRNTGLDKHIEAVAIGERASKTKGNRHEELFSGGRSFCIAAVTYSGTLVWWCCGARH
jgi:hypothetical protein